MRLILHSVFKGFYGANDLEQLKCDMVVDCIEDMFKPFFKVFQAPEEEKVRLLISMCIISALTPSVPLKTYGSPDIPVWVYIDIHTACPPRQKVLVIFLCIYQY